MSQLNDKSDASKEIQNAADTASQMGHTVAISDDDSIVTVETMSGGEVKFFDFSNRDDDEEHPYRFSVNGQIIQESSDDFDEVFSVFVQDMLVR